MKIKLPNPMEDYKNTVEVRVGDRVRIDEWDSISVEGTICKLTKTTIEVDKARFLSGCYRECDYSEFENLEAFSFNLQNVAQIRKANFEEFSPLQLIQKATRQNYCGSEKIIMSPLFFEWYKEYMKRGYHSYCQYPVEVNMQLEGFSVHAVPNAESRKHQRTPMNCYNITFYKHGKPVAFHIFSAFSDEIDQKIEEEKEKFKRKSGYSRFAYKLMLNNNILIRGCHNQKNLVRI